MSEKLKIAVTLLQHFMVRDFFFTPVWDEMARRDDAQFILLHDAPEIGKLVSERNCRNISFVKFPPDSSLPASPLQRILKRKSIAEAWEDVFRVLDDLYLYDSLSYRFSAINDLSHYRIRKGKNRREQQRQQQRIFEYRKGESVGFPFPKSKALYRLLYAFRHGCLNIPFKEDLAFLKDLNPDLFIFGRLQFPVTSYWARVLRRLEIPMAGIVASWDHPTTKGPLPRGMSGYIVASRRMADELSELHCVDHARICQIGKVQMDCYRDPTIFLTRKEFLAKLGVPPDHRIITMGTNTIGIKEHEVSIAQKLAQQFTRGDYGKATLLIRTHPTDTNWEKDFLSLARPPQVLCFRASAFGSEYHDAESLSGGTEDQVFLANLMRHSDIVIQSRGSLALDAIAFDTPVISLAFDGDLVRSPNDAYIREYEYEHYKPLVTACGTWMAGSYEGLDRAIHSYLEDPSIHAEGRKTILREHIEPLDGHASRRLVEYMVTSARQAQEGTLPPGDWKHSGLGDATWAARQVCNAADYVA